MADFQVPDKDLLTNVDRSADNFLIYDNSASNLKRTNVNSALDITSHPVGIDDVQTLTNKTISSPNMSSPVLSGTITGTYTIGGTPTFPNTVVTTTDSQILTNKTLTAPTINDATIANPTLTVDSISEYTPGSGVTIEGLVLENSTLTLDSLTVTNDLTVNSDIITDSILEKTTNNTVKFPNNISADTISEYTSANGVSIDGFAIKDGVPKNWNGWTNPDETWTYASASTFTVSGDQTTKYTKGTRLKWTQTTVKYGVVASSSYSAPNTIVTIAVNTDYVLTSAAITDNYYSYEIYPQGYPVFFNYTPVWTNVSGGTFNIARFSVTGTKASCEIKYTLAGAGVSGNASVTLGFPANASYTSAPIGEAILDDASPGASYYAKTHVKSATEIFVYIQNVGAAYPTITALSSTVPFTWAVSDVIQLSALYTI